MYSKLHRPQKNALKLSENAGSCVKLVSYLDKEKNDGNKFFSHTEDNIPLSDVISKIDNNKRTLKDKQDKFYMLSYNPSHNEVKHLVKRVTGKDANCMDDLTSSERAAVLNEFKEYVRECMNIYASKFNREKQLSGADLVYFGRIEEERHYTYLDADVSSGDKKRGELKEGFNLHAHVIVSRMDASQTISLSPFSKSRSNTNILNGKEVKNGFDMKAWQVGCFELYSQKYGYKYSSEEVFYDRQLAFRKYKIKLQHKVINELTDDFREEKETLQKIRLAKAFINPAKTKFRKILKSKIKNILLDNEPVI